ncbi:hypothetical protein BDU57DRAFT_522928 [Ampelomyces quisqualis]|uniref:Uncharacterized protein n=1 Tax=Ampelomyces quisqualis TaxID=50730 RepID=A0A6A5QCH8_AMPQU|nr:hypothetical protein BDU57DRAFT_522928 [Ampelomyces quisqualis]
MTHWCILNDACVVFVTPLPWDDGVPQSIEHARPLVDPPRSNVHNILTHQAKTTTRQHATPTDHSLQQGLESFSTRPRHSEHFDKASTNEVDAPSSSRPTTTIAINPNKHKHHPTIPTKHQPQQQKIIPTTTSSLNQSFFKHPHHPPSTPQTPQPSIHTHTKKYHKTQQQASTPRLHRAIPPAKQHNRP